MGLKVHQYGYKPTNSLEWWSVIEANIKERLEA